MYLGINVCLPVRSKFVLKYLVISDPKQLTNPFDIFTSINDLLCVLLLEISRLHDKIKSYHMFYFGICKFIEKK